MEAPGDWFQAVKHRGEGRRQGAQQWPGFTPGSATPWLTVQELHLSEPSDLTHRTGTVIATV